MPEVTFGLMESPEESPSSLHFTSHYLFSQPTHEVIPLLKAAEAAAKSGAWVVLMLSYEAAPAFDDALKTHNATGSLPLAWAAVLISQMITATLNTARRKAEASV